MKRKLGRKLEIIEVLEKNGFVRDTDSIINYESGVSSVIVLYGENDVTKRVTINMDNKVLFAHEKKTPQKEIIRIFRKLHERKRIVW